MPYHPDYCGCAICVAARLQQQANVDLVRQMTAAQSAMQGQSLADRHPELLQNMAANNHPTPPRVVDRRSSATPVQEEPQHDPIQSLSNKWGLLTPEQRNQLPRRTRMPEVRLMVGIFVLAALITSLAFLVSGIVAK